MFVHQSALGSVIKMKVLKKITKTIAAVIVIVIVVAVVDFALHSVARSNASIEFVAAKDDVANQLIIYMPGVIAPARDSAGPLLDVWLQYGDVLLVDYSDERFDSHIVAKQTIKAIREKLRDYSYDSMLFIASSMGGRLSVDVAVGLHEFNPPALYLLAVDAPMSSDDLLNPFMGFAQLLRTGPIVDSLGLTYFAAAPPSLENLEPGVDQSEVMRRVNVARSYKLSFLEDQAHYLGGLKALSEGELVDVFESIAYVRCTRANNAIDPQAVAAWSMAFPETTVIEVDSTHVGFAEWPKTWDNTFRSLLDSIPVKQ